jgi:hypothetical protein
MLVDVTIKDIVEGYNRAKVAPPEYFTGDRKKYDTFIL